MGFLGLPIDVRLLIYEELLIARSPITFTANYDSRSPLFRRQRDELCPSILGVNKQTYRESRPLLYSKNSFVFPTVLSKAPACEDIAHITPFLDQIGAQANHIRHICIEFPDCQLGKSGIHEAQIQNLKRLRDSCPNIKVLDFEMSTESSMLWGLDRETAQEALQSLNEHLTAEEALKTIGVMIQSYFEEDWDSELEKQMKEIGWTVSSKLVEKPKQLWESDNGQCVFDNEEDYHAYLRDEQRREEAEEEKQWIEDYHARRRDPYIKNDSDYD